MKEPCGKKALVTGGSSGIGLETARILAERGWSVAICGRSAERLERAARRVPGAVAIRCDVGDGRDRAALLSEVEGRLKGLDLLVNNAGIVRRFLFSRSSSLEEAMTEEWRTNYLAPVLLARLFLPLLAERRGTIANVTSGLACVPLYVEPDYCALKAALSSMTRSMRIELAKSGVRVVEIAYPAVDTPSQGGHAPSYAMRPERAAALAVAGLEGGRPEVRVGMARMMHAMSRLAPGAITRMINKAVPENVGELLAD
jgi:uncharacterized oxidoreductase